MMDSGLESIGVVYLRNCMVYSVFLRIHSPTYQLPTYVQSKNRSRRDRAGIHIESVRYCTRSPGLISLIEVVVVISVSLWALLLGSVLFNQLVA